MRTRYISTHIMKSEELLDAEIRFSITLSVTFSKFPLPRNEGAGRRGGTRAGVTARRRERRRNIGGAKSPPSAFLRLSSRFTPCHACPPPSPPSRPVTFKRCHFPCRAAHSPRPRPSAPTRRAPCRPRHFPFLISKFPSSSPLPFLSARLN